MIHRKITILFIVSLAFNVAFLAALGYRTWEKKNQTSRAETQRRSDRTSSRRDREPAPEWKAHYERLRTQFSPKIKPLQEQLCDERKALGQLLLAEEPDTLNIETRLQNIGKLQTDIERGIVYFVFEEKKFFNPEQRKRYLDRVIKRIENGSSRRERGSSRRGNNRKESEDKKE